MDLFELVGTIAIKNSEANQALEETSQTGEKTQSKLSKAFSAMGKGAAVVGKAVGTSLLAGGAAMGALTIKAMNLAGDLEQNMGGSEQVFKDYAGKMQETAKNAFQNMGLSTTDFLGTANKMGALFQGAGFSIKESSDLSASAMQRAADVASIMGIDTGAAMEAIAGAAKGNFTMMDNLGVAMNDTTLNAYALEKGINKTTQEMTNQEKIGLAMEMFMDKTAYAAGNYARENQTLAGSLGTAKAALTNFLDGSGSVDQLVGAFSNAANVIVNNLKDIGPKLVTGLVTLINQVIPLIPPLLQQLLPVIIEGAVSLVNGLASALPGVLDVLVNTAIPHLLTGAVSIIEAVVRALPSLVTTLVSALPALIPQLVNGLVSAVSTLLQYIPQIIQPLIMALPSVILSLMTALLQNLPTLIQGIVTLITSLVAMLPTILPVLINMLVQIVNLLVQQIPVILPMLLSSIVFLVQSIIEQLPTILLALIDALPSVLQAVWDAIVMIFEFLPEWFGQLFQAAVDLIKTYFSTLIDYYTEIWERIKGIFSPVAEWFGNMFSKAWEGIKSAWSAVTQWFSNVWSGVKNAFSAVGSFFKDAFQNAWNNIKNVFSGVGSFFTGIWDKIKNTFSEIGTKIGDSISGAVKKGINGVIGQAEKIINGFLGMINNAISLINKIPGVNISKVKLVSFTKLAEGGVVDKPTPALFGEDGAEAVVPLEKNTGWLKKVAKQLHEFSMETKYDLSGALSTRSVELQQQQVSEMQTLNVKIDRIISLLIQFFPDALEAMKTPMLLDTNGAVLAMAPAMDVALGKIAIQKGRGR